MLDTNQPLRANGRLLGWCGKAGRDKSHKCATVISLIRWPSSHGCRNFPPQRMGRLLRAACVAQRTRPGWSDDQGRSNALGQRRMASRERGRRHCFL